MTGTAALQPGAAIFGCAGPELAAGERAFFAEADPFGFILFARNVATPGQLRRLTGALREAVGREAPVLIDQEGGRVARLTPPHWRRWPPPLDHAAAAPRGRAPDLLYLRYRLIAAELRGAGIDTNCAPIADIAGPGTHAFLRNRCYATSAGEVAAAARAVAEGLMDGGVLPVVKHLPGHGRATTDSHGALPRVTAGRATLDASDFAPFRALADLPMAMTAHVVYTALDAARPATVSPAVIGAIRGGIGFDGLLMSDDLSMNALDGSVADRAAAARRAGCDVVLHCNGDLAEMAAVIDAAGALSGDGARRAAAAFAARRPPTPFDTQAAQAELAAMCRGAVDG